MVRLMERSMSNKYHALGIIANKEKRRRIELEETMEAGLQL